jgi:hypothetical protein
MVLKKIASYDIKIRKICTTALFSLMTHQSPNLLALKLQGIKELSKQLKSRPHDSFEPNIIECLSLIRMTVNEEEVTAMNEQSSKIETLKTSI